MILTDHVLLGGILHHLRATHGHVLTTDRTEGFSIDRTDLARVARAVDVQCTEHGSRACMACMERALLLGALVGLLEVIEEWKLPTCAHKTGLALVPAPAVRAVAAAVALLGPFVTIDRELRQYDVQRLAGLAGVEARHVVAALGVLRRQRRVIDVPLRRGRA